jgi:hypothetical protein
VCRGSLAREGGSLESYWRFRASGVQISPSASEQEVLNLLSFLKGTFPARGGFISPGFPGYGFLLRLLKKWARIMKFQGPFYSGREFIWKYLKISIIWGLFAE